MSTATSTSSLIISDEDRVPRAVPCDRTNVPDPCPLPPERLVRIENLDMLPAKDRVRFWDLVPGVFGYDHQGRMRSLKVLFERSRYIPRATWTSSIHAPEIATFFPEFRANHLDVVLRRSGLVHNVLKPEELVLPNLGIDPETGEPNRLYPFQLEAISQAIAMRSTLISLSPGLGKTCVSLVAAETLRRQGKINRVITISGRKAQRRTWARFLREYYGIEGLLLEKDWTHRERVHREYASSLDHPYLITRYAQWFLPELLKRRKKGDQEEYEPEVRRGLDVPWLLRVLGPETAVITDEVHHMKDEQSVGFRSLHSILNQAGVIYRFPLTGTWDHDKPVDVKAPIRLLNWRVWNPPEKFEPDEFLARYFDFISREIGGTGKDGLPRTAKRVKGLRPETAHLLSTIMDRVGYRRTHEEVGSQLPPVLHVPVPCDPTPEELRAYQSITGRILEVADRMAAYTEGEVSEELEELRHNMLALRTMEREFSCDPWVLAKSESKTAEVLREVVSREELLRLSPGSKTRQLIVQLGDFLADTNHKVVVFTHSKVVIALWRSMLASSPHDLGLDPEEAEALRTIHGHIMFFEGGTSDDETDRIGQRFDSDPEMRILFSTDAGGESQNFQVASYIIHHDLPLSSGDLEQRDYRIRRLGQTAKKLIAYTLEFGPQEILNSKLKTIADSMADPWLRNLLGFKQSQKDLLKRRPETI